MRKLMLILGGVALAVASATQTFAQKKVDKTAVYEVNVHCKSCKAKIERDLAFEKGVKEVVVTLDDKRVSVKYSETRTTSEKIAEAIRKLGYEAKPVEEKKR